MIEFSNAIKAALYERAKKPFTGTFALAWIVINWKIWFTLLFVDEMRLGGLTKTEFIKSNYINYSDNLWIPIASAVLLIFIIPIFNLGALFIKKWFDDIEFKNILKRTPADGAQVAKLLESIRSQEEDFTKKTSILNEDNVRLIEKNKELDKVNRDYKSANSSLKEKVGKLEISSKSSIPVVKKKEEEYINVVKIINDYRRIIIDLEKEFGTTKDAGLFTKLENLNSLNLRGSKRLLDTLNKISK